MLVPLCAALALALAAPVKGAGSAAPAPRVTSARQRVHERQRAPARPKKVRVHAPRAKAKPRSLHARAERVSAAPRGEARARPAPARAQRPTANGSSAHRPSAPRPSASRPASAKPMRLDRAKALLAAVKRDPAKRRYRHHWERAIAALQAAARGRDRAPALLEAARARYALYRFSQVESDRDAALALADHARRAGAREAAAFAAAVRAEMGDDEPAPARAPPRKTSAAERLAAKSRPPGPRSAPVSPEPPTTPKPPPEEAPEPSLDPALQEALGDEVEEAAPAPLPSGPARVSDVRTWSNAGYTRVAIYLSHPVEFSKEELPAADGGRRRLALDLDGAVLAKGLNREVGDTQVARVRAAQRGGAVRVVLDLASDEGLSVVALQDPPRILVDVGAAAPPGGGEPAVARVESAPKPSGAAEPAEAAPAPEAKPELPRKLEPPSVASRSGPVRRVIVDAGHGGHDTGAIGPSGVREKDVTLAMARRLARDLRERGFQVVLTRSDDRFVPLEERAAIANARRGDLFISLHANAHPRRDQSGVESWILNVADGRYAKRLAARENGALRDDGEGASDVRRVLTDLDAQASAGASRRVAELVQENVCANIRAHFGEVRDLGVKSALFYVLVGARMPAVLVETSFISNRVEERRLANPRFQQGVADGVARAVEAYARRQERLAVRS